ncbi:MAG: bifunctional UDP-N-acetylglucosamine diphosphorylase/glucosamine-1-phosphate N-acetyltransferase GlmU [Epsilonproteobacteria bacterium]|nr:bifunctional UDP-N-acetylglucosamine diphosphorylase/glucosamine-1-phosphate N-acetyltransferase GlmU [Campylobacterota bacterium]
MNKTTIVILAAGFGTRMKSQKPKVLHRISGYEMLYYSIKEAKKISDDIQVVLYHKHELIKKEMDKYFDDIKYVIQDVENYPGTAGALRGVEFNNEKVLILNGDMPLIEAEELERFSLIDADIVMSIIELDNPKGYGRVVIENGEVAKIVEEKDATDKEKEIKSVNAGVYLIKSEILKIYLPKIKNDNKSKEYYLTDIVELAKNDKKSIKPLSVNEENFKGVNSRWDLSNAEEIMQNRIKKELLNGSISIRLPNTVYIEYGVKFEGECFIENGVSIYKNSKIINSHIRAYTTIEESTIEHSLVGPFARIRPNSHIKDSKVGNFVEVKKSTLNGVKAGHLSYLGDSEIDEGTNIGAGTITCNYDGKKKYKTVIGKNVFIGSDTQIVAPVKIEDDVMVAAGTTLTKDAKQGTLVISRSPLKSVKDFYYKFFGKNNG